MSFLEELKVLSDQAMIDKVAVVRERYANNKRAPRESVNYDTIKQQLIKEIKRCPSNNSFVITLPKELDKCMTILDMLKEDGIHNIKINPEGFLFTRVMVSDNDSDEDDFGGYALFDTGPNLICVARTITICKPFETPSF